MSLTLYFIKRMTCKRSKTRNAAKTFVVVVPKKPNKYFSFFLFYLFRACSPGAEFVMVNKHLKHLWLSPGLAGPFDKGDSVTPLL